MEWLVACSQARLHVTGDCVGASAEGQKALSDWKKVRRYLPLTFVDKRRMELSDIVSRCRQLKEADGLDLVFVDYLQLVPPVRDRERRAVEIGDTMRELKALARELDIAVVALSTITRAPEQLEVGLPRLIDLRDSGAIEDDADVVLLLYREEAYVEANWPRESDVCAMTSWWERLQTVHGKAELIVRKSRRGTLGTSDLEFEQQHALFIQPTEPVSF